MFLFLFLFLFLILILILILIPGHRGQILKNCTHLSVLHCTCRAKQRQALLQWGYEPWVMDMKQGARRARAQEQKQEPEEEEEED